MKNDIFNTIEKSDLDLFEVIGFDKEYNALGFIYDVAFDADKKFGINAENMGYVVQIMLHYNPFVDDVRARYSVFDNEPVYEREYIPTEEEKEVFKDKIHEWQEDFELKQEFIRDYVLHFATEINLTCEMNNEVFQIRNLADDCIVFSSKEPEMAQWVGKEIVLSLDDKNDKATVSCPEIGMEVNIIPEKNSETEDEEIEL